MAKPRPKNRYDNQARTLEAHAVGLEHQADQGGSDPGFRHGMRAAAATLRQHARWDRDLARRENARRRT